MSKQIKLSGEEQVALFLNNTQHPLKKEMDAICEIIRHSGVELTEHIKWNAPSFCYHGDDRVTLKLNSPSSVDLVFHRGSKVKAMPTGRLIEDPTGTMKWLANDRGVLSFSNLEDIQNNKDTLIHIINQWVVAAEVEY
ncbi:MAG: DUF1801 domain-containing protein [Saccharofermentanales bacterium]